METNGFTLNNGAYNLLKWVALVLLPGLAALYFGLGQIWHFPAVEQVVGSITVVDTFLGLLLNKSSKNYLNDAYGVVGEKSIGEFVVKQDPEGMVIETTIVAYQDPFILDAHKKAVFDVRREQQVL
jgi:hypothetical protein